MQTELKMLKNIKVFYSCAPGPNKGLRGEGVGIISIFAHGLQPKDIKKKLKKSNSKKRK